MVPSAENESIKLKSHFSGFCLYTILIGRGRKADRAWPNILENQNLIALAVAVILSLIVWKYRLFQTILNVHDSMWNLFRKMSSGGGMLVQKIPYFIIIPRSRKVGGQWLCYYTIKGHRSYVYHYLVLPSLSVYDFYIVHGVVHGVRGKMVVQ